jgi:type IV pilus assembly protein PilP
VSARTLLLLSATLAAAGCGDAKPPPRPPTTAARPAASAAPAAGAAEAPSKPAEPEWAYSSVGKRDPFRSFLAEMTQETGTLTTRCATPLGRFEVEQLKLKAVVTGLEDPVAMVEAPNGVGYTIRRGACIGKNGGTVSAVRSGEVIVSEWTVRADGTRDSTQTVLRLPREAELNLEE